MISNFRPRSIWTIFFVAAILYLASHTLSFAAQKSKQNGYVMTEIELQSELMSFADRFASIMIEAFEKFENLNPEPQARYKILGDVTYSVSAVYTIAAAPNPQVGLLDMLAVTTLGRMIYEEDFLNMYGDPTAVVIDGFRYLEKDLWLIASKVLTSAQQSELRQLIALWRKNNPDKLAYSYLRFSDFAAQRRISTLVKKGGTGGLFKSVQKVTQEVEETRMLAERGIFLATRLPLLTGLFSEVWMSALIRTPEAQKILTDIHTFSTVSERFATVAEDMPDQMMKDISKLRWQSINQLMKEMNTLSAATVNDVMSRVAVEREASIDQFMDRFFGEQKIALEALMVEDQRLTALATELRKSIEGGNQLLLTADALAEKYNMVETDDESGEYEPFDINDYRETISEATLMIEATNRLINTVGMDALLPELIKAIDKVGSEGENIIDHSFQQGVLLILIAMAAYVVGRLILNLLNKRLIE